ncbi:MAG: protoheme IX farnesyltransferase [Cryomorphaceae bacterium]|nr:protoheme IX farnesyltransferase [Cryomorphaceae bacterium]|tara:strand:+ start:11536 stop:12438 length:903 start_codon:yes stop_codon:yes gene_type:complete
MTQEDSTKQTLYKKILVFTKFRLSFLVVLSALTGYLFAGGSDYLEITLLMVGGSFVTAASNGANQIWERDIDKLMSRTQNRPLPLGIMSLKFAYSIVIVLLIIGSTLLFLINLKCMLLGFSAFITYVFIYTPMKSKSAWAVFVGAFPGAIPPLLGAIAATDAFGFLPGVLFFVQFTWQFPHFWAIAWVSHDDYQKAGYHLLPSALGRSKQSAFQILIYSIALIPFSLIPWLLDWTGNTTFVIAALLGTLFFIYAYKLFLSQEDADARKLMFASFVYLPIIQFTYVLDKVEHIKFLSDGFI